VSNENDTTKESGSEVWRPITLPVEYEVSNMGRVRHGSFLMRTRSDKDGYLKWSISIGVHRLVALAFLGQSPRDKELVAHGDGNPANNILDNLRWATRLENEEDKDRHGTRPVGSKSPRAKLTEDDIVEICFRYSTNHMSSEHLGIMFGVSTVTIQQIIRGRIWKHVVSRYRDAARIEARRRVSQTWTKIGHNNKKGGNNGTQRRTDR
jgi:hypothetical protein